MHKVPLCGGTFTPQFATRDANTFKVISCKFARSSAGGMPLVKQISDCETVKPSDEGAVKHISLSTGTLDTPDRGLANLVEAVKLIRNRVKIPAMIECEPVRDHTLLKSLLLEAREAGVTSISMNIECFDEHLRENIMPAKGKIPVREYSQNWEICLEVFGRNEVSTVAIAGFGEDDSSLINGIEIAASQG